jgi:predicted O-methyltransferase YrrM
MDDAQSRLERIDDYIASLFGGDDPALAQNLSDAEAAGLPAINVSANQGRLLCLLAKVSRAERILEIGTLGGYSTTWLARPRLAARRSGRQPRSK